MRTVLLLLIHFGLAASALAGWRVTDREALPASEGIEFTRVKMQSTDGANAELRVVALDPKRATLAVLDNPDASRRLNEMARARGALAGVNGGYFHSDYRPLGLLISGGKSIHGQERAKLLSGILSVRAGRVLLQRAGEYKPGPEVREGLQAGPFLVDGGKPVTGLNAERSAKRTVVFAGAGLAGVLTSDSVTLAELGEIVAAADLLPQRKISRALNLDGGSSTGLWVKNPQGRDYYAPEFKHVRNFLAVVPLEGR